MNTLLIKLKDGRYGLGERFMYRGRVHFVVEGRSFYRDNVRLKDIEFWQPVEDVIEVYLAMTGLGRPRKQAEKNSLKTTTEAYKQYHSNLKKNHEHIRQSKRDTGGASGSEPG